VRVLAAANGSRRPQLPTPREAADAGWTVTPDLTADGRGRGQDPE